MVQTSEGTEAITYFLIITITDNNDILPLNNNNKVSTYFSSIQQQNPTNNNYIRLKIPAHIPCSTNFDNYFLLDRNVIRNLDKKLLLLDTSSLLSDWIQLDTPGFLPNKKQHRMFGLSVLQMSLSLSKHLQSVRQEGVGLLVMDSMSSSASCQVCRCC
jgi:hypothetical protein